MSDTMKLRVETGAVTVDVEDERGEVIGSFDFNPADSNILERFGAVADFFEHMQVDENLPEEQQIDQITRLGREIAEQFDYLLGGPVSQGIFAKCGPLTVTKTGDFFFETVLTGIGSIIEQATKKRLDKKLARIKRATAKYSK